MLGQPRLPKIKDFPSITDCELIRSFKKLFNIQYCIMDCISYSYHLMKVIYDILFFFYFIFFIFFFLYSYHLMKVIYDTFS